MPRAARRGAASEEGGDRTATRPARSRGLGRRSVCGVCAKVLLYDAHAHHHESAIVERRTAEAGDAAASPCVYGCSASHCGA